MSTVTSKDGTTIAFERLGAGPALILVDGAMCSREFGPMPKLAPLLAKHFTVFMYDRRGRGGSKDTQPYAREREVEDIAALIEAAGGKAYVVGLSSGAALAMEAAASGLSIPRLAVYEPPYMVDDPRDHTGHEAHLKRLVAAGQRGAAVKYFMRDMVGIPAPFVFLMRVLPPGMWRKLEGVAHTLPYDAAIMNEFKVPTSRLAAITSPTLAMNGEKSEARLKKATHTVASAIPNAQHRTLKGQTHNVNPEVLTPELVEFFAA
ncbi:MAG: alpha/beta hydrolase [Myxococcota bacterium]